MDWVYLSPHLDDVALSCGGLVWEQAQAGLRPSIWTICAGDPPRGALSPFAHALHTRWQSGEEAVRQRRAEDIASCRVLGVSYRHLPIPDCIYRRGPGDGEVLYPTEASLFGALHEQEADLVERLSAELANSLPRQAVVVAPLAIGGHVDHRLTRAAVERLFLKPPAAAGWILWYYADYPYAGKHSAELAQILQDESWVGCVFPVSAHGLDAWQRAVAAHASQISTFWHSLEQMRLELTAYARHSGGLRLWRRKSHR